MSGLEAVLLVGGLGTRLRSALPDLPKCLAPVDGRPFLERLLEQFQRQGVSRVILALGYGAEAVRDYLAQHPRSLPVEISQETSPLGTGGALRLANELVAGPRLLAANGDSFCDFDLAALEQAHRQSGARATLVVTHMDDCARFGRVEFDADHQVGAFREKGQAVAGWINAGIYLMEREVLDGCPPDRAVSLETEVLPGLVGRGLYAHPTRGRFIDIGLPEEWARAAGYLDQP